MPQRREIIDDLSDKQRQQRVTQARLKVIRGARSVEARENPPTGGDFAITAFDADGKVVGSGNEQTDHRALSRAYNFCNMRSVDNCTVIGPSFRRLVKQNEMKDGFDCAVL